MVANVQELQLWRYLAVLLPNTDQMLTASQSRLTAVAQHNTHVGCLVQIGPGSLCMTAGMLM